MLLLRSLRLLRWLEAAGKLRSFLLDHSTDTAGTQLAHAVITTAAAPLPLGITGGDPIYPKGHRKLGSG